MKGGFREGAGRKKGFAAKGAEEARKVLSERVAQEIGPLSEMLISKAKKGDIQAIKELFDRAWGRSPQSIDMTSAPPKTVIVVNMPKDLLSDVQHAGGSD